MKRPLVWMALGLLLWDFVFIGYGALENDSAPNYGNFDYNKYLLSLGDSNEEEINDVLLTIKEDISSNIYEIYEEKYATVISGIVLGDKSNIDSDLKDLFTRNGIAHILAVSGLHISFIGMLIYKILKNFQKYETASVMCGIIMVSFGLITGSSVSANRAVHMLCIKLISEIIGRKYDAKSAWALSVIITLFKNHHYIYNSSFILSYGVSFYIIFLAPLVKENISKRIEGLSLFMFSLPLTAYFFYQIPTYSVLLNAIVVPMLSILLVSGLVGAILYEFIPVVGIFVGYSAEAVVRMYEKLCSSIDNLPYSVITVGKPSLYQVAIYYVLFISIIYLASFYRKRHHKFIKKLLVVPTFILLFTIVLPKKDDRLLVSFINVGQGDSIFIKTPDGVTFLVDCGSSSLKNIGEYRVASHLNALAEDEIDYAILTHSDNDHSSGFVELINDDLIKIKRFIVSNDDNEKAETIKKLARDKGIKVFTIDAMDEIVCGEIRLLCLSPNFKTINSDVGKDYDTNENSLVLKLVYRDFSMLLTGDISSEVEEDLVNNKGQHIKNITILKVAHHGSRYSSSEEFVRVVNPKISVISYGQNTYGHPAKVVLNRLALYKSKIYTTIERGVMIYTDGRNVYMGK